eukprot:scaffold1869_cov163-Ochromonas_danica.AAC.5
MYLIKEKKANKQRLVPKNNIIIIVVAPNGAGRLGVVTILSKVDNDFQYSKLTILEYEEEVDNDEDEPMR